MKSFKEFLIDAKSDYKRDKSNPNLMASASKNKKFDITKNQDKVSISMFDKKTKKMMKSKPKSYTLQPGQTPEDLVNNLNNILGDDSDFYYGLTS